MGRKTSMEKALEWMREANRRSPKPCPEESFEEVLQGIALPLMRAGLVEDVQAGDVEEETHKEALPEGLIAAVEQGAERVRANISAIQARWTKAEMQSAREYLSRQEIVAGSKVTISDDPQPLVYLGLLAAEHGVEAVVRIGADVLLAVHYSRLCRMRGHDDGRENC